MEGGKKHHRMVCVCLCGEIKVQIECARALRVRDKGISVEGVICVSPKFIKCSESWRWVGEEERNAQTFPLLLFTTEILQSERSCSIPQRTESLKPNYDHRSRTLKTYHIRAAFLMKTSIRRLPQEVAQSAFACFDTVAHKVTKGGTLLSLPGPFNPPLLCSPSRFQQHLHSPALFCSWPPVNPHFIQASVVLT